MLLSLRNTTLLQLVIYGGQIIATSYEAKCINRTVSLDEMQQKYGEEAGLWVWEIIRGIDFAEGQSLIRFP